MESRDLENAKHKHVKDEKVGAIDCHLIEAIPHNKTAYSKVHTWIRKKDFVFVRTRYFDRKGKPLKDVFVKEVKRVGARTIPSRIKVNNKQTKHSTLLVITTITARSDLPDSEFTIRTLKKR
jgi:hypothetical protein